jgi:hypothetical protein
MFIPPLSAFMPTSTQFSLSIQTLLYDNDRAFDNTKLDIFFTNHGILFRFSYPYTSNKMARLSRLFIQQIMASALHFSSLSRLFLLGRGSTHRHLSIKYYTHKFVYLYTPFFLLHGRHPRYHDLHVFRYLCYPNTSSHAIQCLFLSYPSRHRGYRCLELDTRDIIINHSSCNI